MFVRFGEFAFNPDANSLLRQGQLVHLTPRANKLLGILLANRPCPVPKQELERQIWPDTFVAETSLPNVALELRRILDENGCRGFIKTVHSVGYAFIGEAQEQTEAPRRPGMFRVWVGGSRIDLEHGENWIGRADDCRVQVDCSLVSRHHACIVVAGWDATLKDGDSRNGTFLNDRRLTCPVTLHHRDDIQVGSIRLGFRIVRPDTPTDEISKARSTRGSGTPAR